MAIAHDTATTASGTGVTSLSLSHAASGSDRLAVASAGWRNNNSQAVSSFTHNGSAMTHVATNTGSGRVGCTMYRQLAPSTSSVVYAVAFTSTATQITLAVRSYTGVHQSAPTGTASTASTTVGAPGTAVSATVSSAADELVVDACALRADATSPAVDSGQTQRTNFSSGATADHTFMLTSDEPGAASSQLGWSWTGSTQSDTIVVPLKPAAGGATVPHKLMMLGVGF